MQENKENQAEQVELISFHPSVILRDVLKRFHLEEKLHEVNFKNYWQKVCGDLIARHTLKMSRCT